MQSMNSLKFMIDANMPRLVMRNLNDLGYDTVDIRDIEKPGIDDDRIFELAQQEGRIILTRDQDFGNIILYPLETHKGIIVLKTRYTYPRKLGHKLRWILRYNILYLYLKLVEEIYVSKTSKS